jgi:hypothetical protein
LQTVNGPSVVLNPAEQTKLGKIQSLASTASVKHISVNPIQNYLDGLTLKLDLPDEGGLLLFTSDYAHSAPNGDYYWTGANADGSDTHQQLLYTESCAAPGPVCCFDLGALNPFSDHLTVYYNAPEKGDLNLALVNMLSGATTTLLSATEVQAGEHQQDFLLPLLPAGNYTLRAIFKGSVYTKNIVKF